METMLQKDKYNNLVNSRFYEEAYMCLQKHWGWASGAGGAGGAGAGGQKNINLHWSLYTPQKAESAFFLLIIISAPRPDIATIQLKRSPLQKL